MQIRKIAATALGAIMAGASLAAPALAAYDLSDFPQPFVEGKNAQFTLVVGQNANAKDVVGGMDIAARLGGETTEEVSTGGAAGQWSVSGDGSGLHTSATDLRFKDKINSARSTLTSSQMPELLASGTVEYGSTTRDYDQYLSPAGKTTNVTTSGGLENAKQLIKIGTTKGSGLYDAKVTFTQALNVTEAGKNDAEIELFGTTYVIDSSSDNNTLVLWGGRDTLTLRNDATGPASGTYTSAAGNEHTLEVVAVSDSDTAAFKIDGTLKEKNEDDTITVDNEEVKLDKIIQLSSQTNTGVVEFAIGSSKYILDDGKRVEIGGDYVDNTQVSITAGGPDKISEVSINVAAQSSDNDYVAAGESFTDPVFGTFKFYYGGLNPPVDSDSRDEVKVSISGDEALASFTDWQGESGKVIFGHDVNANQEDSGFAFTDDGGNKIVIAEGQSVGKDDYVIVDKGDYPHLLTVDSFSSLGLSDAEMTISDPFSGESYTIGLGSDNQGTLYLDGQKYYFNVTSSPKEAKITWGSGAGYADVGSEKTIFPYLKGDNGERIVVGPGYNKNAGYQIDLTEAQDLLVPSGADEHSTISVSVDSVDGNGKGTFTLEGTNLNTSISDSAAVTKGSVTYNFTTYSTTNVTNVTIQSPSGGAVAEPFAMVLEEKGTSAGTSYTDTREAIIVSTTDDSSSYLVANPEFTGPYDGSDGNIADGDESLYITKYGTKVWKDTNNDDEVKFYYPDDQATVGAFFLSEGASASLTTGTAATTVEKAVQITQPIAKLDTEIADRAGAGNLILVGGPCANTLVEKLAQQPNSTVDACADWSADSPAVIQLVNDAFADGQTALIVAGWSADDTRAAASKLQGAGITETLSGTKVEI